MFRYFLLKYKRKIIFAVLVTSKARDRLGKRQPYILWAFRLIVAPEAEPLWTESRGNNH